MFVQPFVHAQTKETSKLHVTGSLWGESTGYTHKKKQKQKQKTTVTRKMFPFDDSMSFKGAVNAGVDFEPNHRLCAGNW